MIFEFGNFEFEWDDEKADANWIKHGVTFKEAATIFNDTLMMTIPDADHQTAKIGTSA